MGTSYYRTKSKEQLHGRYCESFFVVSLCILVYLIFKALDIAGACVLLYGNDFNVSGLFVSENIISAAFKILRYVLFFAVTAPLITGGLWWFYQTAAGNDNRSILKLYTGFRLNVRAALLYGVMWIIGMLSLIPSGISWLYAYKIFSGIEQYSDQAPALFASFQLFILGFVLIGLYLKSMFTMILAPFIFISHPDMGTFKVLKRSGEKMKGSKIDFMKLVFSYVPAMLPVVTIPFVLPGAVMAAALFAREKIGEE